MKAYLEKYLNKECLLDLSLELSLKYFVKSFSILKLLPKVLKVQMTILEEHVSIIGVNDVKICKQLPALNICQMRVLKAEIVRIFL